MDPLFFFFMIQLYKYHSWNVILSLLFSKFFFFYVIYDNYFVIIVVIICYQVVPITWNIELNKTWCFVQRTSCRHFGLKCFQEDRDGRPEKRIITSSPCLLLLCKGALLFTMQVIFYFSQPRQASNGHSDALKRFSFRGGFFRAKSMSSLVGQFLSSAPPPSRLECEQNIWEMQSSLPSDLWAPWSWLSRSSSQ